MPTGEIGRKETAPRILLEVVQGVLGLVILFELAATPITKQPPSERVRHFANQAPSYLKLSLSLRGEGSRWAYRQGQGKSSPLPRTTLIGNGPAMGYNNLPRNG